MSTLRGGITFAELQVKRDREVAIIEAKKAVVEAAKRLSNGTGGVRELHACVSTLQDLEDQQ